MLPIASLPWYDHPSVRAQLDRFWNALRAALAARGVAELPIALERNTPVVRQWACPRLLLSQCCGPDLFTGQGRALVPVARPVFADLRGAPGTYFSHVVARAGGRAVPRRLAVNALSSRSGCGALLEWARGEGLCGFEITVSGSHAQSLRLVREGAADLAAIDAHCWPLLDTRGVTVVDASTPAPSPPWVMHRDCPVPRDVLGAALASAVDAAGEGVRIADVMPAEIDTYRGLAAPAAALDGRGVHASPCGGGLPDR